MAVITLKTLVKEYYLSFEFKSLRDETKQQYEYFLNVLLDTKLPDLDKPLGNIQINNINVKNYFNSSFNLAISNRRESLISHLSSLNFLSILRESICHLAFSAF